ncbi:hypothetical protein EC973_006662 [Apophysomyces ossiformis]|uniref:S-formylglutathione hydrolase n=1 Tax=Apophysomyces ossiformis TaxID=679940 RepID=A0A8H7EQE1_9FUNG|nr:hypothetical protein EC973_006662 [Apophysomyces ossiformis]
MLKEIARNKAFEGYVIKYEHLSTELNCSMKFNVFLPKESEKAAVPAVYFLSGLTCTEDNFIHKSGAVVEAARHGVALVAPDTSPRGVSIEGDEDSWDFGTGDCQSAGFYVDATEPRWANHYRMYSYIVRELPHLIHTELPIDGSRVSIMGHSMGGHGALTIFLRNPGQFKTVSAFSPISHPIECPWGKKAFGGYLGPDKETWKQYDTVELLSTLEKERKMDVLVDVGSSDAFLDSQLCVDVLKEKVHALGLDEQWKIRLQEGYDHSYYFISTFIADHIQHHVKALK